MNSDQEISERLKRSILWFVIVCGSYGWLNLFSLFLKSKNASLESQAHMIGFLLSSFIILSFMALNTAFDGFYVALQQELKKRKSTQVVSIPEHGRGVYILKDTDVTGYYKIGKTTQPKERLMNFGVKLPFNCVLVKWIEHPCPSALEAQLHRKFAHKRKSGEWFDLDYNDLAQIEAMIQS